MLLALSVISAQGSSLGPTAYKVFDDRGGSIGRLDSNDWTLPDPEKFVSSRHACVRCKSGEFFLEDLSTNGTFVNAHDRPISKAEPVRLQDGDCIFIGDYEILVQLIDDGVASSATPVETAAPPPPMPPVAPASDSDIGIDTVDPLEALGGTQSIPRFRMPEAPRPAAPVAPPAPPQSKAGIPNDPKLWEVTAFRDAPLQMAPPSAPPAPAPPLQAAPRATPPAPAPVAHAAGAGTNELLAALGLDPARVDPAIHQQLGAVLRVVVQGMVDVLQSRSEIKNNFRMPMTSMRQHENNPLKFSLNADDALHNLFVKRNAAYLPPVESFQEGFQDVSFHQMAMLAGIRAAFNSMLGKFHPDRLEEIYERKLRRTALIQMGNRLRYWEMYRSQFEDIEKDMEAHFQLLFGEEFARAYAEQMQKLATAARMRQR